MTHTEKSKLGWLLVITGGLIVLFQMNLFPSWHRLTFPVTIGIIGFLLLGRGYRTKGGFSIFFGVLFMIYGCYYIFRYVNRLGILPYTMIDRESLYMLAVGLAFLATFLLSPGRIWTLVPASILIFIGIGGIFVFRYTTSNYHFQKLLEFSLRNNGMLLYRPHANLELLSFFLVITGALFILKSLLNRGNIIRH